MMESYPDFDGAFRHEEAVGWLEVSVDEAACMDILQPLRNLEKYMHHLRSRDILQKISYDRC